MSSQLDPPPFEIPAVDEYSYRLIKLDNGIQALLIHDPEADKAAAACDVRVGSMSDPLEFPGLAHFTEHMLFYSSKKYPEEDAYSKFISDHGGKTNAYTSNESTQYHFDCAYDALPESLDRFAQFFICPLISSDGVSREANAVDSEHGKNLNSDSWKKLQLWRSTANPGHEMSRFSTGNIDTLINEPEKKGLSPHEAVKAFYDEHYSASLMRVVVLGRHSLDELEELVKSNFADVVDRGLKPAKFSENAVTEEETGILIKVVPERDGHSIELQWDTLSEQQHSDAAPSHYLSHLLGHEGEGSAFAYLKKRGWASGLVAGEASTSFSSRSFFMVRVDLTESGHEHVTEVVNVVFQYIYLIRAPGGITEGIYNEMRALSKLKFDYRDKLDPYQYVSSLAHGMHVYDISTLLLSMYNVPSRFDPDLIRSVAEDLTPERARVMWASKSLKEECTEKEQWYGTAYSLEKLPREWIEVWSGKKNASATAAADDDELHLPRLNEFVPSDFSLLDTSASRPSIVRTTESSRLWFRPVASFKTPKAVLYLHLHLPDGAYTSPTAAVLTQLYAKLVNDALSELTYPADLAGLHYGLRASSQGILVSVSGYHHRLPHLAQAVLQKAFSKHVSADRFAVVQEKLKKDYANMKFEQPYQMALYELSVAAEAKRWHVADYSAVLPSLTSEQLTAFLPHLLSSCYVESYAAGNLPQSAAEELVASVEKDLKEICGSSAPAPSQAHEARVVKLRPGNPVLLPRVGPNPANDNSAVVVSYQIGLDSPKVNALTELVAHIGKRPAFHQLRTVEQLGYLTFFTSYWTLSVRNLVFIIQSSAHSAVYLESRVENFLPVLRESLSQLTQEEFTAQIEELAKVKLERPKRLREVASRDWREIDDGVERFDRQEDEVAELRKLTHEELLEFFDKNILDVTSRKKVAVHVQAAKSNGGNGDDKGDEGEKKEGEEAVAESGEEKKESENDGVGVPVEVVSAEDVFKWKRRQDLYPSLC
jgi:insulysin